MIKKTETCNYSDQPETLNVIGQLESNCVHWHQILPIDVLFGQTFLEFTITEKAVIGLYIVPQPNILFKVFLNLIEETETLMNGKNSLSGKLNPGHYLIQVLYDSDFGLPNIKLCPGFEIDLSILPFDEYSEISAEYTCRSGETMPESLTETMLEKYLQYGAMDKYLSIKITENSEVDVFISFETVLSGYVRMEIYDSNKRLLEKSIGNQN